MTIRYSYEIKPNPQLPPQAAEAMTSHFKPMLEEGTRMQLKGKRAFANVLGITSVCDFHGEWITILHAKQARYATAQRDVCCSSVMKP